MELDNRSFDDVSSHYGNTHHRGQVLFQLSGSLSAGDTLVKVIRSFANGGNAKVISGGRRNIRVTAITRYTHRVCYTSYSRAYSRFPAETHELNALVASSKGRN